MAPTRIASRPSIPRKNTVVKAIAPMVITAVRGAPSTPPQAAGARLMPIRATMVPVTIGGITMSIQVAPQRWTMTPIVTGTIVALIGINLAPAAWGGVEGAPLTAVITIGAIAFTTVFFRGMLGRLAILVGAIVGY